MLAIIPFVLTAYAEAPSHVDVYDYPFNITLLEGGNFTLYNNGTSNINMVSHGWFNAVALAGGSVTVDLPVERFFADTYYVQDVMNDSTVVFSFPVKSPKDSVTVKQVGAMEQLKLWKAYQEHWCEHKPSVTIYYTDSEFLQVAQWIWENFDICSGISLLPTSDHIYQQAPYEAIDEDEYNRLAAEMPKNIDWENLSQFEQEDNTTGSQELACAGGACEIV